MVRAESTVKPLLWKDVAVVAPSGLKMEPAGLAARLEAFLVDYLLCLCGAMVAIWASSLSTPYLNLSLLTLSGMGGIGGVFVLNHLLLCGLTGQTVGKMMFALRVVRSDGGTPGWGRIVGRSTLGYSVSLGLIGLGLIMALWDSEHRTWHDKLFSTYVVRVTNQ